MPHNVGLIGCEIQGQGQYEWLKKSALSYERQGLPDSGYFTVMCDFYQRKPNASASDIKQAYLWCMVATSLGSPDVPSILNGMRQSGKLKLSDSQVAALLTPENKITEWPELMVEARKVVSHEDLPVFSYEFKDETLYRLKVYSDGRVVLNPQQFSKSDALLMKVDSKRINAFIKELNQIGFNEWPLVSGEIMCDFGCGTTFSSAMLRINNAPRRVTFYSDKMEPTYANKKPMMIRQAKLKVLVDN